MCKAYLFHTTSIFNFVQMPVADKYTDILYMRTHYFHQFFMENQSHWVEDEERCI